MYGQTEFKLHGDFKVEVFDGQTNALKSDSDYFSNYITEAGLSYPFDIVFAECFKILHVGSGNSASDINTTGLSIPLPLFKNISTFNDASCGYVEHRSGVSLYRAWRVPEVDTFSGNYTFKEFGVAPTTDPYDICTGGNDPEDCPPYRQRTGFQYLFARAIKDVSVSSGDYALVTYKLNAVVNTGIRTFGDNMMNISSQTNCGDGEFTATGLWNDFTGIYRQIHHGLALVAPDIGGGATVKDASTTQPAPLNYTDSLHLIPAAGKSFVPGLKVGLEPCLGVNQFAFYISSDGFQFLVSESGGAWQGGTGLSGGYQPYDSAGLSFITNRHSGLAGYIYDIQTHRDYDDNNYSLPYIDMRRTDYKVPVESNFLNEVVTGKAETIITYSSATRQQSVDSVRNRSVIRTFTISSTEILTTEDQDKDVKSILMGYQEDMAGDPEGKWYPIMDALIVPGATPILPNIDIVTGKNHNKYNTLNQTGEYMAFDICHNWGMSYRISWTAAGP